MTILVTGGAGFIGSNFVLDWLAQSDEPVVNLDAQTYAGNLANLAGLTVIVDEFARLRDATGMVSASMRDVDRVVRGVETAPRMSAPDRPSIFS